MMDIVKRAYANAAKFTKLDRAIFKICMIAFGILIAKLVPEILSLHRSRYVVIFAVPYIRIVKRVLID